MMCISFGPAFSAFHVMNQLKILMLQTLKTVPELHTYYVCVYFTDAESETKKTEWREIAKKELEDWYKHREEQLEKTFKLNRWEAS